MQVARLQEEIEILGTQMANFVVAAPNGISTQATTYQNNKSQFGSPYPHETMNTMHCHQAASVNHTGYTTGNQTFDSQMNGQLPPYAWDDENFLCDSYTNPFTRSTEEVDPEIFANYLWLDSSNNTINLEGINWE